MGCCLVVIASWLSPRLALFLVWLFGDRLSIAFDSFAMGLIGFIVVPWTTLMYTLAYAPIAGVKGLGWILVAIGLVLDIGTWTGGSKQGGQYRRGRS